MKKILVLTSTFPRYINDSTAPFVYELCRHLIPQYRVIVLAPHYQGAKFNEMMNGVQIHRFPYFFPYRSQKLCYRGGMLSNIKSSLLAKIQVPFFLIAEFAAAWRILAKEKPQVIHAHWTVPSGIIALVLGKIFNIPVVVTAHAADVFTTNAIVRQCNGYAMKHADVITVNSQATKKALVDYRTTTTPISIIPMGVDVRVFKSLRSEDGINIRNKFKLNDKKVILFVGRLEEKKGITYLLKAFSQVLQTEPLAHLLIIGQGSQEHELRELSQKMGLEDQITFMGKVSNSKLPLYYSLADVFVAPSIRDKDGDTEGLGVVILEAMACETPVVASRIGGITDIIEDDKNGLLVVPKDIQQLSQAINRLLENRKLTDRLRINARVKIEQIFDWRVIARQFEGIYEQI